jgi:hypothetical protein
MRLLRGGAAVLACLAVLTACGTDDGHDAPTAAPDHVGAALADADALLAALEVGGAGCRPGSIEEDRAWDEHTGSCTLSDGGTIFWQLDLGAATRPPETPQPGELGSGEERPSVHDEVCEHFGGQVVLGQNWMVMGPEANLALVASALDAYLFVAQCDGSVQAICDRTTFSGQRVYVTISARDVALDPTQAVAGPVVICLGVSQPGRAYAAFFVAEPRADLRVLETTGTASAEQLYRLAGVTSRGAVAVTLRPGAWSEQAEDLPVGSLLVQATVTRQDTVPELPEGKPAPVGVLTVSGDRP